MADDDRSIIVGTVYMLVLTIALSWIPVIGPFVAGVVGGRKAGTVSRGILAAILPAIVAGVIVYVLVNAIPGIAGWIAAIFATAFTVWVVLQAGFVLIGAVVGGWSASGPATTRAPQVR